MASPSVKRAVGAAVSSAATVWPITVAGNELTTDLAVLIVRTGAASTVTITGGCPSWTQLLLDNTDATDDNTYVFYGRYDINFYGDIKVNLSASVKGAWALYTLSGAADPATRAPEVSARQIFTTAINAGNSPAISPTGGSKDYLFITVLGMGGTITPGNLPANYNAQYYFGGASSGGSAAANCSLYGTTRAATTATEDPGAWTHSAANLGGVTFTIAVHPAGPPPAYGVVALPITFGKDVKGFVPGIPALETTIDKFNRVDGKLSAGAGSTIWTGYRLFDPNNPTDLGIRSGVLEVLSGDGYATQEGSLISLKDTNDFIFDYVTDSGTDNYPVEVYMAMSNEGPNWNGSRFIYDAGSNSWIGSDYLNGSATNLGSFPANGRPLAGESYWFKTVNRSVSLFKRASASDPWSKLGTWNCSVRPKNSGRFGFLFRGMGQRIDNLRGGPILVVQYGQVALPLTFGKDVKGKSTNLIDNGYFEQGVSGWYVSEGAPTFAQSTVDAHEGAASMKVTTFNQYDSVATDIPTEVGRFYVIGFWVKRNEFTQNDWRLETSQGLTPTAVNIPQVGGWQYITMTVQAQWTGIGRIAIRNVYWPAINDGSGFVYVDEVRAIQYVPKQYYGSVAFPITFGKEVRGRLGKNYHDEVLADSPLVYWRMDEVGLAQDYSGNGYHVTSDAGSIQVPGLVPFEPNSMAKRVVDTMARNGPFFTHNTMTFEVWLQRGRTDLYEILIDQYNSGWTIAVNSDGRIGLRRSYGPDIAWSNRIRITDDLPHHLAVSRNFSTGEAIFYLDDQVPESVIGTLYEHGAPANYPCFIGSQWGAYVFTGTLDEMAIYPYVLSPNQIAYHRTTGLRQAPKTLFGATAFPITFNKEVNGARKTFAKTNAPFVFSKDVKGARTTFSKVDSPITFGEVTSGIRVPFRYYGQVALPITFSKDVKGQRKSFGRTALPITFAKDVNGRRTTFGKFDLQIVGGQYVRGILHSYSQSSMQTLFGKETAGRRKTFGQVAVPLTFSKDVRGKRKTFGRVALPIVFDANTIAQRQTFGQVTAPFIFDSSVQGTRTAFGKFDLPMNLRYMVGEGHLGVHGEISLPMVVSFETSGKVLHAGIILNAAKMIYLGTKPVIAVYTQNQKVWPAFSPLDVAGLNAWIDASQDEFIDGQQITRYVEHSSKQRAFIPVSLGYNPIYRSGNGNPYLEFVEPGSAIYSQDLWNPGPDGFTMIAVNRLKISGIYPMIIAVGPGIDGYEMRYVDTTSQLQASMSYQTAPTFVTHPDHEDTTSDHLHIIRTSTGKVTDVWVDDDLFTGPAPTIMRNVLEYIFIGQREGGYPYVGRVHEILLYSGPVSDSNLTKLREYLKTKHSI